MAGGVAACGGGRACHARMSEEGREVRGEVRENEGVCVGTRRACHLVVGPRVRAARSAGGNADCRGVRFGKNVAERRGGVCGDGVGRHFHKSLV
jgi:hypothetical protein